MGRERQRQTKRHRHGQRDTQTDRVGQTDRETDRQGHRQRWRNRQTEKQTDTREKEERCYMGIGDARWGIGEMLDGASVPRGRF
jgi:hypothetical protein